MWQLQRGRSSALKIGAVFGHLGTTNASAGLQFVAITLLAGAVVEQTRGLVGTQFKKRFLDVRGLLSLPDELESVRYG
jgi:hypothetical protein